MLLGLVCSVGVTCPWSPECPLELQTKVQPKALIHGEGPYFSWLKAPSSAFTFKTLLRHYAKQAPKHVK